MANLNYIYILYGPTTEEKELFIKLMKLQHRTKAFQITENRDHIKQLTSSYRNIIFKECLDQDMINQILENIPERYKVRIVTFGSTKKPSCPRADSIYEFELAKFTKYGNLKVTTRIGNPEDFKLSSGRL